MIKLWFPPLLFRTSTLGTKHYTKYGTELTTGNKEFHVSNNSFKGLRFVTKVPCTHSKLDPVAQERIPVSATLHYRILPKCNKMAAGAHKMAPSGSEDHSSPTTHIQSRKNLYQWFLNLAVQDNHRMFEWGWGGGHVLGLYSDLINLKTPWDTCKYPYDSAAQPGMGNTGLQD